MTGENRRQNASDELARAERCMEEARTLAGAQLPYGAASRAYFAVFHSARALLFSVGLEPTSHKGLVSMIGDHFVRSGQLSPAMGRLVSRMQRDREDADYEPGAVFTGEQASQLIADAETFLAEARRLVALNADRPGDA